MNDYQGEMNILKGFNEANARQKRGGKDDGEMEG